MSYSSIQRAIMHTKQMQKERKNMKIDKSKVIWDATSAQAEALKDKHVIGFTKYDGSDAMQGTLERIEPIKGNCLFYHFRVITKDGYMHKFRFILPDDSQLELVETTKEVLKQEPVVQNGEWTPKLGELVLVSQNPNAARFIRIFVSKYDDDITTVNPADMNEFMKGGRFSTIVYKNATIERIAGTNLAPPKADTLIVDFDMESFKPHRDRWITEKGAKVSYKIISVHSNCVQICNIETAKRFLTWEELAKNWLFDDGTENGTPCYRRHNEYSACRVKVKTVGYTCNRCKTKHGRVQFQ